MDTFFSIYNSTAIIVLGITSILWAGSHIFAVVGLKELDFTSRILGYIGCIILFFISGWKGGLLSIPIIMIISTLGAWEAKKLRNKLEKK